MNTTPRHSSPLQTVMIIDSMEPGGLREKSRSSSMLALGLGGGDGGVPRSAAMAAAAAAAIPPPAASSSDGLGLGIVVAVCFVWRDAMSPIQMPSLITAPPPKNTFPTFPHTFSNCPRNYEEAWQWWCSAASRLATPHLSMPLPPHIPSPVGEHRGSCVGVAALRHGVTAAEDIGGDDDVAASSTHREAGIASRVALAGRPEPDASEGEGMATSKSVIDRLSTRNQMSPFHTCPPSTPFIDHVPVKPHASLVLRRKINVRALASREHAW